MPKQYLCPRAETPPTLDGTLSSPAWNSAPWTDSFVDIEGDAKPAPRFKTRVKMLWDDNFFYIGAQLEEPQVWGTLTKRDSVIFYDNDFEVFLDPDGDNHNYYELEINALNTVWDLRLPIPYRDGGGAINEWDIKGLRTAVSIDGALNNPRVRSQGWSVEIALPWRALGEYANCPSPPRAGDQWRINFSRVEWDVDVINDTFVKIPNRPEHNWVWSPQGVIDMHQPERWGYVQFVGPDPTTQTFHPVPSAPAREFLMSIYHAQQGFKNKNGHFATTINELGLSTPLPLLNPTLEITEAGFEAAVTYRTPQGQSSRLHVRTDSLLWH